MKSKLLYKLFAIACGLLLALAIGEILIRSLITYDTDHNAWIGHRILKPYKLPVKVTQQNAELYFKTNKELGVLYDSIMGWTLPSSILSRGLNSHGIKSGGKEFSLENPDSVLRIALFGDSYIFGAEIAYEGTIGYQLEQKLKAMGLAVEVLNFGVGGYGMDQAYLRWKQMGKQFLPDIVIFGFQPENVMRNVNMLRTLYSRKEALPFAKPRFQIHNTNLQLINAPTPTPDEMLQILENIENWNLVDKERFYTVDDYMEHWWLKSKLIAYLLNVMEYNRFNKASVEENDFNLNQEPAQLTLQIIEAFKKDVESTGAQFLILHLPRLFDLQQIQSGKEFAYSKLLNCIEENNSVVHTEFALLDIANAISFSPLFMPAQHYSAKANAIVVEVLVKEIH